MKLLRVAVCLLGASCPGPLSASLLPIVHLGPKTLEAYEDYVARFEQEFATPYYESGRMWADSRGCCSKGSPDLKTPLVEPRFNGDIPGGSIHHFSGVIHLPGGTIEDVRHIVEDYANYPKYYPGDVSRATATQEPDSNPADEHYHTELLITQSTVWMSVNYTCIFDTHYRRLTPDRWASKSVVLTTREWRDPRNPGAGFYSDRDDHGLFWRSHTYWFVRTSGDGIDVQADSLSLSRPIPTGFGWWGVRRSKDAVSKMLLDMKAAIEGLHRPS